MIRIKMSLVSFILFSYLVEMWVCHLVSFSIDRFHVTAAIMVQRSIGVKDVIAFVNTSRQFIFVAVMRISSLKKFSWICWL